MLKKTQHTHTSQIWGNMINKCPSKCHLCDSNVDNCGFSFDTLLEKTYTDTVNADIFA